MSRQLVCRYRRVVSVITAAVYMGNIAYFSGCGTQIEGNSLPIVDIQITADHPLIAQFKRLGMSAPSAIRQIPATNAFEVLFADGVDRLTGTIGTAQHYRFVESMHLIRNGVAIRIQLDASGLVTSAESSEGMAWSRPSVLSARAAAPEDARFDPVFANHDLIEFAEARDQQVAEATTAVGDGNHAINDGVYQAQPVAELAFGGNLRVADAVGFTLVLGIVMSVLTLSGIVIGGGYATAVAGILGIIGGIAGLLPPPAAAFSVSTEAFQARLVVIVDEGRQEFVISPGERMTQMIDPCPTSIRLVELILVDGEGHSASTVFSGAEGSELIQDQNFACGDEVEIQVMGDMIQVSVADSGIPAVQFALQEMP